MIKRKILIFSLVLSMVIFGLSISSFAQEGDEIVPEEQVAVTGDKVSLDFKDADIRSVLKIISYKAGVNIVVTPEVAGAVTIKLQDVLWEKALNTIVKTYGYDYEWISDNVIMVSTLTKLTEQRQIQLEAKEKEPLDTDTFTLNFTKAAEIKIAIEKLVSERGTIMLEERSNTLIITDTKSNLIKIGEIIKKIDKSTPQVMVEVKILETTLGDTENLGINWTTQVTAKGSKRPVTWPFNKWGKNGQYYPVPEYTSEYADGAWTITSGFPFQGEGFFFPSNLHALGAFPAATATDFTFGTLDFSSLQTVLEMLDSRTDTNIISNPRITTLNNKTAKILVGQLIPLPLYEYSKDSGTRVISGYEQIEVGIKLEVTPNINEQDYITLEVKPSVDAIDSWIGTADNNYRERPIIITRSAETTVMIKDNETLVIGGLISETSIKVKRKVPFLGDIPFIGKLLFTKTEDSVTKTDLLIFITPKIVRTESLSSEESSS